jgi:hypothetical protein
MTQITCRSLQLWGSVQPALQLVADVCVVADINGDGARGIACDSNSNGSLYMGLSSDSRRAALMTAAARRRGSRGQSPLVGEAETLQPVAF